jgi:Acyl-CoA dehydrogenases
MSHGNASLTPTGRLRLARCVADAELACSGCRSRRASAVGGVPYEVYLQLLEEIAQRWLTPALAMSVRTLSCTPLLQHRGDGVLALLPDLLGIAACAVGLAQAALDLAVDHTRTRRQFGRPLIDFQGLAFMLADADAAIVSARATYIDAARRKDAGLDYRYAAAVAKLVATDAAMRDAKLLQIFEGTSQIQRMVIARDLSHDGLQSVPSSPMPSSSASSPTVSAGSSNVTTSSGRSRSTSST